MGQYRNITIVAHVVISVEYEDSVSELLGASDERQLSALIESVVDHQTIKRTKFSSLIQNQIHYTSKIYTMSWPNQFKSRTPDTAPARPNAGEDGTKAVN